MHVFDRWFDDAGCWHGWKDFNWDTVCQFKLRNYSHF